MGRWISADPLAIHGVGGDMNPYAYVRGRVTRAVDLNGLDDDFSVAGGFDESTDIASEVGTLNNEEGFDQSIVFNDDYLSASQSPSSSQAAMQPGWLTQNAGGVPAFDSKTDPGPISGWPEVANALSGAAIGLQMSSNPLSSAVAGLGGGLTGGSGGYGVGVGLMGGGLMQIGAGLAGGTGAGFATAGSFGFGLPVTAPAMAASAGLIANGVWAVSVGAMVMMQSSAANGGGDNHHVATNKNNVSPASGGPWTPRFQAMFDRAGMSMTDADNIVNVIGHAGPHPEAYHQAVYNHPQNATAGLSGADYASAFRGALQSIGREVATPGSPLNLLVTR